MNSSAIHPVRQRAWPAVLRGVRAFCVAVPMLGLLAACGDDTADAQGTSQSPPSSAPQINNPPTISGQPGTTEVVAGTAFSFKPTATDPENDTLTFSIENKPNWAQFNTATGELSGVPTTADAGTYSNIVITVSDGKNSKRGNAWGLTVKNPTPANQPPTISGSPPTAVRVGEAYAFRPTASDPEGKPLTFSIANRPAWAAFDTTTGALTGTPGATAQGTYANVSISVSDGSLTATLPAFTVTVQAPITGSATVSWQPPTTRADGTALVNLAGFRIYHGTVRGGPYPSRIELANPGLTAFMVESLPAGTHYFVATAYDAAGMESARSVEVSKTIQ